jgi:uncharacterized membrane protein YqjE
MGTPGGAEPDPASSSAPSSTVRSAVRTLLSFAETRARLAANEFEEQLLRLLEVAAWAVAAVFFFAIAVLLVSLFIVLVFWDSNRVLAAGLLAGLFIAGGGVSVLMVRACMAARPKFLAATLAEFEKDRQRMQKP